MQYIDLTYLQGLMPLQKIVECCDDYGAGELDEAAEVNLDACEQSAMTDIHLYCRGLYTVPFDPVPDEVKELTAQLTKCYLYMRRAAEEVPESINQLYKRVQEKLKAITENTFRIDSGDDSEAAAQGPRVTDTVQRFPQGFMGGLLDE
jgi:hypothetical protein